MVFAISSSMSAPAAQQPAVSETSYGRLLNGDAVNQYTLTAGNMRVKAINYGAIITHIEVPDRNGNLADVVLGYDKLSDYEQTNRFFGALVGRYAGRIRDAKFSLDGHRYQLSQNNGKNQLHGGAKGFDKVLWQATTESADDYSAVRFSYRSVDGEEGYPGNLDVTVSYILNRRGELAVEYRASTDRTTVLNLTQHSYFNLAATPGSDVLQHRLQVNGDYILELDKDSLPTGKRLAVAGTPFDFNKPKAIGRDIQSSHPQLAVGKGYDHYWINSDPKQGALTAVAELSDDRSGRKLTVLTTEPGLQIYTANYLSPAVVGKNSIPYKPRYGICLETGQFPNAPAEPLFPLKTLQPGQSWQSQTVFRFSTTKR